eukprot:CAMPEP_0119365272 /NCGR_PEP_ID=MMETSP1334-20130426/12216_1 /TAXON_ID=127549 /ORGANISM="Calcidiscus leptoporus, Strain RCC1130" /LENGTH=62 /DNA_ID=CAMNT_0007381213 /DNA_START=241 /DNA_END=426 /DNA_ORIENTATION=-
MSSLRSVRVVFEAVAPAAGRAGRPSTRTSSPAQSLARLALSYASATVDRGLSNRQSRNGVDE